MNPSTSAALRPASSRHAFMHSKWSEWVLASGRLPTLVSATPTMAYLPLMFDIESSEQNRWSVPQRSDSCLSLPHHVDISNLKRAIFLSRDFEFRVNDILSKIRMRSADIAAFAVSGKVSHKTGPEGTQNKLSRSWL